MLVNRISRIFFPSRNYAVLRLDCSNVDRSQLSYSILFSIDCTAVENLISNGEPKSDFFLEMSTCRSGLLTIIKGNYSQNNRKNRTTVQERPSDNNDIKRTIRR